MEKEKNMLLILAFILCLFIGCSSEDATEKPDMPAGNLTEEEIESMCEKTWNEVEKLIGEKFLSADSPAELEPYFHAIKEMDYVQDVICTETSVGILLKNGNAWSWMVKNKMPAGNMEEEEAAEEPNATSSPHIASTPSCAGNATSRISILNHISRRRDGEKLKILIFCHTALAETEGYQSAGKRIQELKEVLENKGAEVVLKTVDYAMDDLDEYDLCLLHTHGEYLFGKHRILTSVNAPLHDFYGYRSDWTITKEMRDGELALRFYYTLSEKDIKSRYDGKFKTRKTFLFVDACESLKDNHDLAKAFIHCGAGGYIGYTNPVDATRCTKAAESFFLSLLNDSTVSEAYAGIPQKFKYMKSYTDDGADEAIACNTQMECEFASDEVYFYCYGHVCPEGEHPHLIDMGDGIKWSCCNVGASNPYSAGDYYSWGETHTKSQYSIYDNEEYQKGGYSYGNSIACSEHDVAWVSSNGTLRMPLRDEFQTLIKNCDITWADYGTHVGAILTSRLNGNKLFICAGGWIFQGTEYGRGDSGILWSADRAIGYMAHFMQVMYNAGDPDMHVASSRWSGHNVRGVAVSK